METDEDQVELAEPVVDGTGDRFDDSIIYRSSVRTTRVGELNITEDNKLTCECCNNEITDKNPRLVCEICGSSKCCKICDTQLTRTDFYKGFKLEYDWPLCRQCYRVERDRQKLDIDRGNTQYYKPGYGPTLSTTTKLTDSLSTTEFEPIIDVSEPDQVGKVCGVLGLIAGIISIFFLGFLLGIPAIILGYMARVRGNPLGNYGILTGFLGLASSIFWFMITGSNVWFL